MDFFRVKIILFLQLILDVLTKKEYNFTQKRQRQTFLFIYQTSLIKKPDNQAIYLSNYL